MRVTVYYALDFFMESSLHKNERRTESTWPCYNVPHSELMARFGEERLSSATLKFRSSLKRWRSARLI